MGSYPWAGIELGAQSLNHWISGEGPRCKCLYPYSFLVKFWEAQLRRVNTFLSACRKIFECHQQFEKHFTPGIWFFFFKKVSVRVHKAWYRLYIIFLLNLWDIDSILTHTHTYTHTFTRTRTHTHTPPVRAQSCLILFDFTDCSPSGSSVHGIFQARVLEWVAIVSSEDISKFCKIMRCPYFFLEKKFFC